MASTPSPTPAEAPDAPPGAPRGSRRLGPLFWVTSVVASLSIAVLVATVVVSDGDDGEVVAVEDFVAGEGVTAVDGRAEEGQPIPATSFEYLDGGEGSLADFAGRPLLINFWASTCAPCLAEMPAIEAVHADLGDELTVIGFDVAEAPDPGREMVERTGVTYLQARDPRGDVVRAFGGIGLPHTVVVDADGVVTSMHNRPLDEERIREVLQPVLGA